MQLTEIRLKNFRVYQGEHSLELAVPTPNRNVYLIGGLNGAGKTSLFSALTLCLYGRDAAGLVFERGHHDGLERAYSRFIEESFSFGARAQGENEMWVKIGLTHDGSQLRIQRTWWFEDGRLDDESLVIYEDNKPLRVFAESEKERLALLEEYVEGLAPTRVAKFFFFDGEEIRSIAAREPDQAVIEGLNQLLGFHTLGRLIDDLHTLKRAIRKEMPGASDSGLLSAYEEMDTAKRRLEQARADRATATEELEGIREQLETLETEIRSLFDGRAIGSRSEALDELSAREREIGVIDAEIQTFVAEVLALSLPSTLLPRASKRAKAEAQARRTREAKARLRPLRDQLIKLVLGPGSSVPAPALDRRQRAALKRRLNEAWELLVESRDRGQRERLKLFTTQELEAIPNTLLEVKETARRELLARLVRRSHLQAEVSRLRGIQHLFDTGPRAQELLESKGALLERVVAQEVQVATLQRHVEGSEQEVSTKQGVVTRLEEQLASSEQITAELVAVDRLQAATAEFMAELRRARSAALSERITQMMRQLAHKEDLVNTVEIDPKSFGIKIYDRMGEEVLNLSAGEREIFALSLVWGLGQISNRSLPVLIDTPLGRLDQMHRANVVRKFLPQAGQQVIVLATDSEIDDRWYRALKPHIAQEVVIEFSAETQSSVFRSGEYLTLSMPSQEVSA